MYQRNTLGGICLAFLFVLRLGEGIADTWLGEGYIDPVLGCSFVQNPITGQLYEFTDLAIDFISTICIGVYLLKARAGNVSAASNSIYASIGITNLIRNLILTAFNVILSIILNQDPTSGLIVPLFQFQLVAMFGLTCYERDILLLFKHIYEGTSDQDKRTILTNDTKKLGTMIQNSKGHSSIAKEQSIGQPMQKEASVATRNDNNPNFLDAFYFMPPASGKKGKKQNAEAPKEEPVIVKKADTLKMPAIIRRNYLPRTYSGQNLLYSTNLTGIAGRIEKSVHTLIWHFPRDLDDFPPLVPLEYETEMKLLDIIMGDDPLNEATVVQDDQKKRAQLAESGLKEALWQAGKKRVTLQERHNTIILSMQETLRNVAQEYNDKFKHILDGFLAVWLAYAEYNRTTVKSVDVDLAKHSLQNYQAIKQVFEARSKKLVEMLVDLEKTLEDIENERAKVLGSTLLNAADQLKKLNFQRHDAIDQVLKDESISINTILLNNRESIYEYVYDFHKLLMLMNDKTRKKFEESDRNWQKVRWDTIYPIFNSQVRKVYDVDIAKFYLDFNSKFRDNVQLGLDHVLKLMDEYDDNNLADHYRDWMKHMDAGVEIQAKTIEDFLFNLNIMEKEMAGNMAKLYFFWYSKLHEINPDSHAEIIQFVKSLSKDEEIQKGKRASISLLSKAKINRFIKRMVIEFLCCLSCTKSGYFEAQLIEVEIEVSKQLHDVSIHYDEIMETAERTFQADLLALQNEFKESNIPKKVQKIKEHHQLLAESLHERFKKSVEIVNSLMDKAKSVYDSYEEILEKMFKEKHYNGEEANLKFLEHQFWQHKIHEWKLEQAAFIKHKYANENDSKSKKLAQVKVGHRERTKSDAPTTAQRKDTLLDGTIAQPLPNALTLLEAYDFKESSDLGYLVNITEDQCDSVVTINVLDPEPIKKKRLELSQRIFAESAKLWEATQLKMQHKIELKTNQLVEARMQAVNTQLRKILATENAEELSRIAVAHENEAVFIVNAIEATRNTLTSSLKNVLAIFKEFVNSTMKETTHRLANCKSALQLHNLRKEFHILVEMFQSDIKEELGSALANFDHSKKMIGRSRAQGNHSSAWLIIKEQGTYDPGTIISVLDNWRNGMEDEMNKLQKDVSNQIKQCKKDFESYEQDFIFLDFVQLNWKKIRNMLKGETIKCNKVQSDFATTINSYILMTKSIDTWNEILILIENTRNIQREALQLAKYLCCAYTVGTATEMQFLEKSILELWGIWKDRPHLNIHVQNQNIESLAENPLFPSETISRGNSAGNLVGSMPKLNSSKNSLKSSQPELSNRDELKSRQTQSREQTDLKSNISSRERQEVKSRSKTTETGKSTSKTNTKSNKSSAEKDTLLGLDEAQIQENKIDAIVKRWIDTGKKAVTEKFDAHIATNQIKKTDVIPSNMVEFILMIDKTFISGFLQEANQFKESQIKGCIQTNLEFHQNLQKFYTATEEAILDLTKNIRINTIDRLAKIWRNATNKFVDARKRFIEEQSKCEKELKLINTKYEKIQEIERLDKKVSQISGDLLQSYHHLQDECSQQFLQALVDFIDRIQFLTVYISGIFDDYFDINFKPGDTCTVDWQVLEPLDLSKFPFKQVVDRYSKFSIQCKKSADGHRQRYMEYRKMAVDDVLENILHHFSVLESHGTLQEETEKNYLIEWEEKSTRTKRAYQ
ncbi:hypothetical protein HDV06_005245 [Boothiomyces sp. JEL0866]|nr:hypothetical protein HDV06_005245 [Boothiomyces sp. JEL0866]